MSCVKFDVYYYHERYKNGESAKTLCKEVGVHYATMINKFKENNLRIYNRKSINLNHHYFDKIDSHRKAYFLGLLFADGCINRNRVIINLQERDKHIIDTFKKEINYSGKLRLIKIDKDNQQNQFCLEFSSINMTEILISMGCVEKKSNILSKIPNIDTKYINSFILGYFDGDGTVGVDKRSNNPVFSIYGNKDFLESIRKEFDKHIFRAANGVNECHIKNKFSLDYKSKRSFFELYEYLYKDCDIFLFRKKQKFQKIIEKIDTTNNRNKKVCQMDMEDNIIQIFNNIQEVKEKFNLTSVDKISKCLRGVHKSSMGYKWKTLEYDK